MGTVITSALEKAFSTVVVKSLKEISSKLFNSDIENILINKTDFDFIIDQEVLLEELPEIEVKPLIQFLKSDDIELIVQQIYNPNLTYNSIEEIRNEFCLSFSRKFDVENSLCESFASKLFDILIEGCKITLDKAMSQGLISAHDAKTQLRFNLVEDKLNKISDDVKDIKKNLNTSSSEKHVYEDYDSQIKNYLKQILDGKLCPNIEVLYTEISLLESPIKDIFPLVLKAENENKPAEFEISVLVEKESKLIISGDSGSGKTTTLRWLTYSSAKKCVEEKNPYIPIYVELNNYVEGSFLNYVTTCAKEYGLSKETAKTLFESKIEDKNILLLIDGLDLLTDTNEFMPYTNILHFITGHPSCRYIISSRPGFFDRFNKKEFKISEIQELTKEKIASFIDRYVGSKNETAGVIKKEILNNENVSLFTNPLMLFLAINIAFTRLEEDTILPSSRTKLYEYFIENLFSHYNQKGKTLNSDKLQIEGVAKNLYFAMQSQNTVRCERKDALKLAEKKSKELSIEYGLFPFLGSDILDDLFSLGIFKKDNKYVTYGFHQSFQEYFSAIKLRELYENGFDISSVFVHPKWENAVILMSDMLENSDEFVNLIINNGELDLASKCAKNITENLRTKLCNSLYDKRTSRYSLERISAVKGLGILNDLESLKYCAKDADSQVREIVAEVLGDCESEDVIEMLNELVEDDSEYVSDAALYSLSGIGSQKAIETLLNTFKLDIDDVNDTAYHVLRNSVNTISLNLLVNGLRDKNNNLRISCIYLLQYHDFNSEIEYDEIIDLLASFLENNTEDDELRISACNALIAIGNNRALEYVNNFLIYGNNDVRDIIGYTIAESYDSNISAKLNPATKSLIEQLKTETNCDNKINIITYLGLIDSDEIDKELLHVLKNDCASVKKAALDYFSFEQDENIAIILNLLTEKDTELKIKAIKILGEMKTKLAIDPLMRLLESNNQKIQTDSILALGKINQDIVFEDSIQKMKADSTIKEAVIDVVSTIKSKKAANHLIELLKDEDKFVRIKASYYLKEMSLDGLDIMIIEHLKDEDVHFRCNLIEILGIRQSEVAVEPLIKMLEDEDDLIKIEAVKWLGFMKVKRASNRILSLLDTTNINLKISVINSLGNLKSEEAGDILLDMLKEDNSEIKIPLIMSLGQMAYSKAFKQIIIASEQNDSLFFNSYRVLKNLNGIKHKAVLEEYSMSDNLLVADICFEMLSEVKKAEMMEKTIFEEFN